MPPNRKKNVSVPTSGPVIDLNLLATPNVAKYPPLTLEAEAEGSVLEHPSATKVHQHEQEQEQRQHQNQNNKNQRQVEGHHVRDPTHPANNYWDWPNESKEESKQRLIDQIVLEEKCRQLLSIDHIQNVCVNAKLL